MQIGRSSRLLTCKLKQTLQISVIRRVPFQQMVTLTTKLLKKLNLHIPDKIKVKLLLMQHRLSLLEKENKSSLLTPWTFSLKQSCCGLGCIKYRTRKKKQQHLFAHAGLNERVGKTSRPRGRRHQKGREITTRPRVVTLIFYFLLWQIIDIQCGKKKKENNLTTVCECVYWLQKQADWKGTPVDF